MLLGMTWMAVAARLVVPRAIKKPPHPPWTWNLPPWKKPTLNCVP